jgi:hypothetical protein
MTSVCYFVDLLTHTPASGPQMEHILFFGPLEEVLKDLEIAETSQRQLMIAHADDDVMLAIARVRLQIIKQLQTHDMATLPKYPAFGAGAAQYRDPDGKAMFRVQIKVSLRGEVPQQDITKATNIILPPGV